MVCKKWHVAKRLLDRIRQVTNVPAIEYLFNEEDTALPDLGGIQTTLEKRTRHRRALMRMLFDYYETDRLIVCMDPATLICCRISAATGRSPSCWKSNATLPMTI